MLGKSLTGIFWYKSMELSTQIEQTQFVIGFMRLSGPPEKFFLRLCGIASNGQVFCIGRPRFIEM